MVIACTTCNAENPEGSVFCEECGIELDTAAVSAPDRADTPPSAANAAPFEAPADTPEPLGEEVAAEDAARPSTASPDHAWPDPEPAAADPEPVPEITAPVGGSPESDVQDMERATLTLIEFGSPSPTVIPLQHSPLAVGKFDPAQGPIDIDLSHLTGNEYISRRHAELYFDDDWTVRDLGSTNGVFIRRQGQSAFLPRLQTPFKLEHGDEIAFGNMRFLFQKADD